MLQSLSFKKFQFLLCAIFLSVHSVNAQKTNGLSGQIVDEAKDVVELASVVLLNLPDSTIVGSTQTGSNGRFLIENITPGNYAIRISFIGFMEQVIGDIKIEAEKVRNLGVITFKSDFNLLDEVLIERSGPAVQYELDKTIFNMTPDIQAMSVNATELLEQIPMVELDEEGVPSVMGQNVTVLIDGRPSRVYGNNIETVLKLIPSGIIEKVEVITSPSARYTTEQGAIVLNIITKAERLVGVSGIASLSGTSKNSLSPSVNLNITRKRIGFNNSISFGYEEEESRGSVFRENRLDPIFFTEQNRVGKEIEKDFSYNGNLFYRLDEQSTFGVFFGLGRERETEDESLFTRTYTAGNDELSSYNRAINAISNTWQYRGGIDYKKTFSDENQVLDIRAYFSTRDDEDVHFFNQKSAWEDLNYLQHQIAMSEDEGFTVQADYVHPFSDKSSLETGVRANWDVEENKFTPSTFDNTLGDYVVDENLMNDFEGRNQQFSAYAMFRTSIERFSLQAGARVEQAYLKGEQNLLNQTYENDFLNLIPTLNLSYRLKNEDNLKFSYNRRARRPWWNQLNPFVDYSNPDNIRSGNPELDPELINSFEFSYGKFINQFNLFGSAFYRHSNNPIQNISTIDDQGISYTTYDNIGKENYYGLEAGAGADIIPTWNVRMNIGLRKNEVTGFSEDNSTTSFTGRFSSFYPLPFNFRGYAFVNYFGPRAIAQGEMNGVFVTDLGIRKSLMDKKLNISLRASDIFNNREFIRTLDQPNFMQRSSHKRQSRYISLSLSYVFGSLRDSGSDSEPEAPNMDME
ncbi:MAG TPA: TonB-dependent receptor [Sphingobacteriaceae bacterium]|nr:TonB-dependent receptor [Sphingobacteriaceae bacterium]